MGEQLRGREDRQVTLDEASHLTGYSKNTIRNHIYTGRIGRASRIGNDIKKDGKAKRGEKIRLWLSDLIRVYRLKEEPNGK